MTDDMLALARANAAKAGATNFEFLKGDIEAAPLPDRAVHVVISNCSLGASWKTARDRTKFSGGEGRGCDWRRLSERPDVCRVVWAS
jgi:Methyltransferase domain